MIQQNKKKPDFLITAILIKNLPYCKKENFFLIPKLKQFLIINLSFIFSIYFFKFRKGGK
jgi:hypothetical protein